MRNSLYVRYGKRIFDACTSFLGIVLLSPIIFVIAAAIKVTDQGPIFFTQSRVGMGFRTFRFIKFRTMIDQAEKVGPQITIETDPRITRLGRFLRTTKFDELPQLLNVLRGDISLVGPRPEVPKYVKAYERDYREILEIRPGITDFSAIEFMDEQVRLQKFDDPEDAYLKVVLPQKIIIYKKYLREMSFRTDLKLIVLTLLKMVSDQKHD
jgi:lipopolysaccharide/colanic/teichoic acid biosynthesis glycosyltransferase